jgi:hypothetical protein
MQFNPYWQLNLHRPSNYKSLKQLTMRKFFQMEQWFKKHHALSLFGRIGKLRKDLDEYEYRIHWIYNTLKNGGVPPDSHADIAKETAKDLYNVNSKTIRERPKGSEASKAGSGRKRKGYTSAGENILAKEFFPGFKPISTTGKGPAKRLSRLPSRHSRALRKADRDRLKELALL